MPTIRGIGEVDFPQEIVSFIGKQDKLKFTHSTGFGMIQVFHFYDHDRKRKLGLSVDNVHMHLSVSVVDISDPHRKPDDDELEPYLADFFGDRRCFEVPPELEDSSARHFIHVFREVKTEAS